MNRWWILVLVGCQGPEPEQPPAPERYDWVLEDARLPIAPDDPIWVQVAEARPAGDRAYAEPIVVDAAGAPVVLHEVEAYGTAYAWAPAEGFPPGAYTVVGTVEPAVTLAVPFEVAAYGETPVDGSDLVGTAWIVDDGWTGPTNLVVLATSLTGATIVVTIEALEDDAATFTLTLRGDVDCTVLRDVGTFDAATGRLTWSLSQTTIEVPHTAGLLYADAEDLFLEVAWVDSDEVAWGRASGWSDTRALAPLAGGTNPEDFCDLIGVFGDLCHPCEDGVDSCAGVDLHAATLTRTHPPAADAPMCGVDRVETVTVEPPEFEPIACDFEIEPLEFDPGEIDLDCGCKHVGLQGGVPALLALAFVRRRRRSR